MKWGIECEGRFKGVPMIFCDAEALLKHEQVTKIFAEMHARGVSHVYVSDATNSLDYGFLASLFVNQTVTLDCTAVRPEPRPDNLNLMLRNPTFELIQLLDSRDQIKFEKDRTVYVWALHDAFTTVPSDFEGDIEL